MWLSLVIPNNDHLQTGLLYIYIYCIYTNVHNISTVTRGPASCCSSGVGFLATFPNFHCTYSADTNKMHGGILFTHKALGRPSVAVLAASGVSYVFCAFSVNLRACEKFPASLVVGLKHDKNILLMKEMLHHLGCIKPSKICKEWDKLPINWLFGISSINGIKVDSILLLFSWFTWSKLTWVFVTVNCWFFRNLPWATGEGFYQCHQTLPNVYIPSWHGPTNLQIQKQNIKFLMREINKPFGLNPWFLGTIGFKVGQTVRFMKYIEACPGCPPQNHVWPYGSWQETCDKTR